MSRNPLNLALRFFLELAGLAAFAVWGWQHEPVWLRRVLAIGLPVLAALAWAAFRTPGDHPKPGWVDVPGPVRLLLEALYFGGAVWALASVGRETTAWLLGGLVALHYLASYDRVLRLLRGK